MGKHVFGDISQNCVPGLAYYHKGASTKPTKHAGDYVILVKGPSLGF